MNLTPDVLAEFAAYEAAHPEWGSLHVVLSDGNTRDRDVEVCRRQAEERGDADGQRLAAMLSRMSRSQRSRLPFKV